MDPHLKEIGRIIKYMVMENTNGQTGEVMKEIGVIMWYMEKEFIPGQTAANTKDISTMTRKKVMAYSST
jgi:hypothetical protein